MRNTFEFIRSLLGEGISVSLAGDLLKIEPKALLTDEIRTEIRKHKADLIKALRRVEPDSRPEVGQTQTASGPSCRQCFIFDGAGSSWPGMCRYFEQLGQESREIDFKAVNPDNGCRFYQEAVQESDIAPQTSKQGVAIPTAVLTCKTNKRGVELPSPVATAWLLEHREELKGSGWTAGELWRRNKSKRGIAWISMWKRRGLQVDLTRGGVIQFGFPSTRGSIRQTARPRKNSTYGVHQ